jgi:hypothetical protein
MTVIYFNYVYYWCIPLGFYLYFFLACNVVSALLFMTYVYMYMFIMPKQIYLISIHNISYINVQHKSHLPHANENQ